jgi:glutamate racemase
MQIGVFDSGKGGKFIAEGLRKALPAYDFTVVNDRENVPYGSRSNDEIIALTIAAVEPLIVTCPIIVVACNTATMAAIASLRSHFPQTRFVGTEPMIKPADAGSSTRHITVLATPLTLSSQRYNDLKSLYSHGLVIDEPSTLHWARDIEFNKSDTIDFSELAESIHQGSDSIILACTHYLVLKDRLQSRFPAVKIYEPTRAIADQIIRLADQLQ